MEALYSVVNFIATYILGVPAIMIALVSMVGLILQKKDVSVVVSGTMKSAMGYIILSAGANILVGCMTPLGSIMNEIFGFQD